MQAFSSRFEKRTGTRAGKESMYIFGCVKNSFSTTEISLLLWFSAYASIMMSAINKGSVNAALNSSIFGISPVIDLQNGAEKDS